MFLSVYDQYFGAQLSANPTAEVCRKGPEIHMSNISHERSVPLGERGSSADNSQTYSRSMPLNPAGVAQTSNTTNPAAPTTYTSPSPPPPAPLSSLHVQPMHPYESNSDHNMRGSRTAESANAAYVNYTVPRNTAPIAIVPWPAASNASMDPSILYSLERVRIFD